AMMGLINGVLTAKLLLPAFIATVATMSIYRGLVSLPTNGAPAMLTDPTWTAIGTGSFVGVPIIIWIVLVLFLVNHL
ncbi:ABC transporter permease, partial [Micrococcus sp. SIMBA_144]